MGAITGGFSSLLAPGLRKVLFRELDELQMAYNKIFNIESSSRNYEVDRQVTGLGAMPEKPEGTAIPYSDPEQAWTKTYTHVTYGMGIRISRELYKDDLYGVAKKWAKSLGASANATIETTAANILNNGFTATGPDGQNLFDTGHTLQGDTATPANRPSTDADLSVASLEAALTAFRGIRDEKNLRQTIKPRLLVVHPNDEFVALKLVQTTQEPFNANNTKNIIANRGLQVVVWDYLSDTDAWFLLGAPGDTQLNFFWRERPWMDNEDDFETKDLKYSLVCRFSCGYSDWRGTYGTIGG